MKNAHIREAKEGELTLIRELAKVVWPDTFGDILSKDQIDYMLNWMYSVETMRTKMKAGHLFYLLQCENEVNGYAHVEKGYPNLNALRIHKLYLLPSTQGKGLGRFFLDELAKVAEQSGLNQLHLNVNRFNKSVGFYHHYGFLTIEEVNNDIGSGYWMEDFVMTKNLNSNVQSV